MQISMDQTPDANLISAMDGSRLRVRDTVYSASLIISARTIVDGWPVPSCAALEVGHLEAVLATAPEIILLGSGRALTFPSSDVMAAPLASGVGIEVMDTAAACRTYNLLVSEGRAVTAALILDGDSA